ncbi:MAG: hypothetical protein NZ898_06455 [Myxococcota bacterium]|nr:hypothetical protein [Myxococcota bacterium]MDW8362664.1 hypothetical protein [Myxococcales bacterium]
MAEACCETELETEQNARSTNVAGAVWVRASRVRRSPFDFPTAGVCWTSRAALRVCRARAACLAFALAGGACGHASSGARAPQRPQEPYAAVPLLDRLPDGAHVVLIARPLKAWRVEPLRTALDALLPPATRAAFEGRTGIDPARLEALVVAEYQQGWLSWMRGPWRAEHLVEVAGRRMTPLEIRASRPYVRRGGWIGAQRYEWAAVGPHTVAVSSGPIELLATSLARVGRGRWPSGRRSAVEGLPRGIREAVDEAPLALLWPGRLALPPETDSALLLARVDAVALTAMAHGRDAIALTLTLAGELPPDAASHLRAFVTSIARSELGAVLGLAAGLERLSIELDDDGARVRMLVRAADAIYGLRVLFSGSLRELVEGP